jgi:flagellar biosynthetic protein FlhB
MAAERTEQPTQRRREDARRRGQVGRSREVDSAIVLVAALGFFRFGGAAMWSGFEALLRDSFAALDEAQPSGELASVVGVDLIGRALLLLLPLFAVIIGLSLVAGVAQTGGLVFSPQAIKPQGSRLNLLKGAKRVFASKQSLVQLAKSLAKFVLLGGVAAWVVHARWEELTSLGLAYSLFDSLGLLVDIAFDIVLWVTLVLVALAVGDYLFQRYDLSGQLRMTRQEVLDEQKQQEGDPQVKAQLARVRRSLLARVMEAVPDADVVLVNPTHYAVALKYDATSAPAPVVVAKGVDLIAQRIREVAVEYGVPVIENPPLTRAIYQAVEVGREITAELYEAVAEVLAFVYRLRHPSSEGSPEPEDTGDGAGEAAIEPPVDPSEALTASGLG